MSYHFNNKYFIMVLKNLKYFISEEMNCLLIEDQKFKDYIRIHENGGDRISTIPATR